MKTQIDTLLWQFDLAWRLAQHHLPALNNEACLWAPAPGAWSVRQGTDGLWRPDWSDAEPDPAPAVTIGWLTWHLIWWWSRASAALTDETPPLREHVFWPGDAASAVARIEALAAGWRSALADLTEADLERPSFYPWAAPRPLRLMLAWANVELMKNAAEIGAVRHLYEAARRTTA